MAILWLASRACSTDAGSGPYQLLLCHSPVWCLEISHTDHMILCQDCKEPLPTEVLEYSQSFVFAGTLPVCLFLAGTATVRTFCPVADTFVTQYIFLYFYILISQYFTEETANNFSSHFDILYEVTLQCLLINLYQLYIKHGPCPPISSLN